MSLAVFIALFLIAAVSGAMIFFGAIVAPTLFKTLDEASAGRAVRALFPKYYLVFALATLAAGVLALAGGAWISGPIALFVGAGFLYARFFLVGRLNANRDLAQAGDIGAKAAFDQLHKLSVQINMGQLAALLVAFALMAWR